jgi:hypothetical protein
MSLLGNPFEKHRREADVLGTHDVAVGLSTNLGDRKY